jgi:hypothetical protein
MEQPQWLSEKYKRTQVVRAPKQAILVKKALSEEQKIISRTELEAPKEITEDTPAAQLGTRDFQPFALSGTSSFNPSNLTPSQLKKMNQIQKSKYLAYQVLNFNKKPTPQILQKISESEMRARKRTILQQKETQLAMDEAKKKFDLLHKAIEDPEKKQMGQKTGKFSKAENKTKTKRSFKVMVRGASIFGWYLLLI